ncbi:MAG: NUDIX domain-containing protein [Candidatus Harrisonbacteria bacterium]|nr:NUDIX domain-containing protein [Candidatus Harrisonbacteria bacterium]
MPREISAGIIIYKREKDRDGKVETKYLLLYHGKGYWNFPKGKLEAGERGYDAALREVVEETGISSRSLRVDRNFKVTDKYIYQREGQKFFKIVIFFLAQAIKPEVKISWEHEGYGWFLHNDAQRLLKHRNSKAILKNANDHLRRKEKAV